MKIEVAKEGRMAMSGQGIKRAMQNDNMPALDLLVRESIQNSLDAYKKGTECVRVDFGINIFDNRKLAEELEGITNVLISRYYQKECKYLYIRDRGTEGLTGPLHFSDKDNTEKKNLLKLVYEIAKPQEEKGAGGSWGYGKTVYFRIGIGLVIYYSRIREKNGEYQSRLAACLVEDENKQDALLREAKLNAHRGLAWWGKEFQFNSNGIIENGTIPETKEDAVEKFLAAFNFEPFKGDETGTAIIIPYVDEKKLLSNNINTESIKIPWADSTSDYLKIAVQRWYIGRLNNPEYYNKLKQPWLQVTVDGEGISNDDMAKTFKEIQLLYNLALNGAMSSGEYHCEPIKLRNYFKTTITGHIAYKMYTADEMEMNPPFNNPSPFVFVKNDDGTDDYKDGDIILTYFRKPGMAVAYDTAGEWVNKIKCNNEKSGNILIAVFVLNSKNKFENSNITDIETIEDYFRSSERADHAAWYDINVNDTNPRILAKIQQGIRKKINDTYKVKEKETEHQSSSLSKLFGEFLLPPEGFGKKAKGKSGKSKTNLDKSMKHKNVRVTLDQKRMFTKGDILNIPITIEGTAPFGNTMFTLSVVADGYNIPLNTWKSAVDIDVPFFIESLAIKTIQAEQKTIGKTILLNGKTPYYKNNGCIIKLLKTEEGDCYGIQMSSNCKELIIAAELNICIKDFMAQLTYQLKGGE